MPLSSVPIADLNSSSTFMMTSMTLGDGAGYDTERVLTTQRGIGAEDDFQDKVL